MTQSTVESKNKKENNGKVPAKETISVSYTHLRAHETS